MPVINTNINSIVSQNATNRSDRAMTNTMEKLSTGYRINKSGDDAAGLAVSTKMTAQVRGTYQAARNISDAVAMVQTADGALREPCRHASGHGSDRAPGGCAGRAGWR